MAQFRAFQQKHPTSLGDGAEEWVANVVPVRDEFEAPDAKAAIAIASKWTEFLRGKRLARYPMVEEIGAPLEFE